MLKFIRSYIETFKFSDIVGLLTEVLYTLNELGLGLISLASNIIMVIIYPLIIIGEALDRMEDNE